MNRIVMELSKMHLIAALLLMAISLTAQTRENLSEISFSIYGIESGQDSAKIGYCIADLDEDGILDSLTYDLKKASLLFSLSSRDFEPLFIKHEFLGDIITIGADTGWFELTDIHMRSMNYESFVYDSDKKRFRLSHILFDRHDGHESYSLDLLRGGYEGYMAFYDDEKETLLRSPEISMHLDHDPIYLDDEEWTIYMPGEDFFRESIERNTPDYTDTITFFGYDIDYDFWQILGEKNGEPYSVICGYLDSLNRGDVIALELGTSYYQEYGDKEIFYVITVGYSATKIIEGKLSQFYRENKKEINYHDIPTGYIYSVISPMDVDYFLANSADKTLLKYFKQPGSFEIEYADASVEDIADMRLDSEYVHFVTVTHKYKEKETLICRLLLCVNNYVTDYYLFDEKSETYKPWK